MNPSNNPNDVVPNRPASGLPPRPAPQRAVFSDFTARPLRPARPAHLPQPPTQPVPAAKATPAPSHPVNALRPAQPQVFSTPAPTTHHRPAPTTVAQPAHHATAAPDSHAPTHPHHKEHEPNPKNATGHAGWVGLGVFVVLAGLLLSPIVPGKILSNFPGSSQSFSTGDQSLACISAPTDTTSKLAYNSKLGAPIVYVYSTTTTDHATCDGKAQTAVTGHTSQFNPLGLAVDAVLALVVAIAVAKVWRKIFGSKN